MLDPAMELIRQAFENVVSKTGDRPWLVDGKAWHLEEKCHPRGRAIVESLMRLIEEAAPGAEGPDWGQKHYIAWTRNGRVWVRVGTRANQAALFIYGSSQTPEAIAAELGYELFEREAEQSDKLALGSSVVGAKDGSGVRIIVKHSRDLGERQSDVIRSLLRDSWARTQGQ
jgi:hypothetical protein